MGVYLGFLDLRTGKLALLSIHGRSDLVLQYMSGSMIHAVLRVQYQQKSYEDSLW